MNWASLMPVKRKKRHRRKTGGALTGKGKLSPRVVAILKRTRAARAQLDRIIDG